MNKRILSISIIITILILVVTTIIHTYIPPPLKPILEDINTIFGVTYKISTYKTDKKQYTISILVSEEQYNTESINNKIEDFNKVINQYIGIDYNVILQVGYHVKGDKYITNAVDVDLNIVETY